MSPRHLTHHGSGHQRLFDDPSLFIPVPTPSALDPENLPIHLRVTLKLTLRSHPSKRAPSQQGGRRRTDTHEIPERQRSSRIQGEHRGHGEGCLCHPGRHRGRRWHRDWRRILAASLVRLRHPVPQRGAAFLHGLQLSTIYSGRLGLPYSSRKPVKHVLASESRVEMAKIGNAKVGLHCEQPACRGCRLISPSRLRQRGRLKYIKRAEARICLDGLGEKRDGLVQSSGETAHHSESVEGQLWKHAARRKFRCRRSMECRPARQVARRRGDVHGRPKRLRRRPLSSRTGRRYDNSRRKGVAADGGRVH